MEQDEQVKHLRPTAGYGERFKLTLTTHKSFLEQRWRRQMSFRGVRRKGWSPALERTVPCDVLFCLTGAQVCFLGGSNAKELWLRCPWFTLHSSRLWFWSLRLTVSWGYLLRRSSSVQSDITISLQIGYTKFVKVHLNIASPILIQLRVGRTAHLTHEERVGFSKKLLQKLLFQTDPSHPSHRHTSHSQATLAQHRHVLLQLQASCHRRLGCQSYGP